MLFDCFLTAQNSARTGQILGYIFECVLKQLDLKWLQCFSIETYKAVLRRMLFDCFLTAQNSARTGQILGYILECVLKQLDLKWLQCFTIETYQSCAA